MVREGCSVADKNPLSLAFWDDEWRILLEIASPELLAILFAGARSGALMLPPALQLLIDWNWFNQAAINWLNAYQSTTLFGIHNVTQKRTISIIQDWIRRGERLPMLIKRLEPWFEKNRAQRVAVTEITRAYAEGNMLSWQASGIVGAKKWQTARDERVCPICGPLHNEVVGLQSGWTMNADGEIVEDTGGEGLMAPPAHVRCRCWLLPVIDLDMARQRRLERLQEYA